VRPLFQQETKIYVSSVNETVGLNIVKLAFISGNVDISE
jgi:hypothetical protein